MSRFPAERERRSIPITRGLTGVIEVAARFRDPPDPEPHLTSESTLVGRMAGADYHQPITKPCRPLIAKTPKFLAAWAAKQGRGDAGGLVGRKGRG